MSRLATRPPVSDVESRHDPAKANDRLDDSPKKHKEEQRKSKGRGQKAEQGRDRRKGDKTGKG